MLRKTLAGLLLMLTTLPFTAPFATVDMPTLLGTRPSAAPQQTLLAPSIEDTSHALVAPSARSRTRIRTILRLETDVTASLAAIPAAAADGARRHRRSPLSVDRPSLTALRI